MQHIAVQGIHMKNARRFYCETAGTPNIFVPYDGDEQLGEGTLSKAHCRT